MIEFTIKTLDSINHRLSVYDHVTIEELKQIIQDRMGIEKHLQRLIFCGRVLQDEKKLSEYNVDGKVVHLVQRAPPSPRSRHSGPSGGISNNNEGATGGPSNATVAQQQIRRLMGPYVRMDEMNHMSPTTGRLEMIRRIITDIRTELGRLDALDDPQGITGATSSTDPQVEAMETEDTTAAPPNEQQQLDSETTSDDGADPVPVRVRRRILLGRHSRPRDLASLIEELDTLHQQFQIFRSTYVQLLRDSNNPRNTRMSNAERQHAQAIVDMVSDVMHSFAHAYHAISDLKYQVGSRNPRLTAESSVMRHPIPMQTHINVFHSNRRPPGSANNPQQNATTTNQEQAPAAQAQTPLNQSENVPAADTCACSGENTQANVQTNQTGGRNSTQPTFNINIQPDPVTYQVEIETRVPIAFAVDNALNSLSTNENQNNQTQADTAVDGPQNATRNRQVVLGMENQIFRGLGQPSGVEVVVRMEEISQNSSSAAGTTAVNFGTTRASNNTTNETTTDSSNTTATVESSIPPTAPPPTGISANATGVTGITAGTGENTTGTSAVGWIPGTTAPSGVDSFFTAGDIHIGLPGNNTLAGTGALEHAGVLVAPLMFGAPPSAEILHNIVASLIRQGLIPGVDPMQNIQNVNAQNVGNAQTNANVQPNTNNAQANNATITVNPPTGNTTQQNANRPNNPLSAANISLRRANVASRAQPVSISGLFYDPFLNCDNQHARRRLQRVREVQRMAHHDRTRFERENLNNNSNSGEAPVDTEVQNERNRGRQAASANVAVLQEHIGFTNADMQVCTGLLNREPSPEAWLNAVMVTVARDLFLMCPSVPNETPPEPSEFRQVRATIWTYIQTLLKRQERTHRFAPIGDYFVNPHTDFVMRMPTIAAIQPEIDILRSIRSFFRDRALHLVPCARPEGSGHEFIAKFYSTIRKTLQELCALIASICVEGVVGLNSIYRSFVLGIINDFEAPVRQCLWRMALTILKTITKELNRPIIDSIYTQFVRFKVEDMEDDNVPNAQTVRPSLPTKSNIENLTTVPCMTIKTKEDNPTTSGTQEELEPTQELKPAQELEPKKELKPKQELKPTQELEPKQDTKSSNEVKEENPENRWEPKPSGSVTPSFPIPIQPKLNVTSTVTTVNSAPTTSTMASTPTSIEAANVLASIMNNGRSSPSNAQSQDDGSPASLMSLMLNDFGTEWMPVFETDRDLQNNARPVAPYSDAYLTGMPAKKRRCVRQMRPPITLDGFMNETINEVAPPSRSSAPTPADTEQLRAAFREQFRAMTSSRAATDSEYDSTRYTALLSFIQSRTSKNDDNAEEPSTSTI